MDALNETKIILSKLDFLDTETGMTYCGDSEEFYLEMLRAYLNSGKYEEIRDAYEKEQWDSYRISVHALKSTSLSVGAVEMSELAKALEKAAKENDISYIREHHAKAMEVYKRLLNQMAEVLGSAAASADSVEPGSGDAKAGTVEANEPETVEIKAETEAETEAEIKIDKDTDKVYAAVQEQAKAKPHILIVDDNAMNLQIAEKMLRDGFLVSGVTSGKEALDFLERGCPDLILLDLHMPEMNGFEVIECLKAEERFREIPVVFLTADNDKESEIQGFAAGAQDFITKPFVKEVMLQRVSRILELDRLQKHLQQEVERQTRTAEERKRKLERLTMQVIRALASTVDAKDKYTNGHSMRVAKYSAAIAERMGMGHQEQENIYYMGLLHDIGKIGIPDGIINKTTRLSDEEYEIIKTHPVIGAEILKNVSEIPGLGLGTRGHHEQYDGRGYPDGLKGEEIPFEARVIAVADSYDAMASKRSYRDVLPQSVVRAEIAKGKGTQFDPLIADVMLELIDEDTEYSMHE